MSPGGVALLIVVLGFVAAFVLGFVLLGLILNRRWKFSVFVGCALLLAVGLAAGAADYGVRYGHWNDQIHEKCVRESGPKAACP